ncbi:MAG TPA: hypothetical protein VFA10_07375 [Ktedonobacteraceae bacterium]|nr:hypothetical protein [Ktedonobacteraceae bacterium]
MIILRKKVLTFALVLVMVLALAITFVGTHMPSAKASGCSNNCFAWTSIQSNFNGTPIPGNDYIWFTSVMKVQGLPSSETWFTFRNQQITFTANGQQYTLPVPNGEMDFNPSATCAINWFSTNEWAWQPTIPFNTSGNVFLSALAFQVPSGGFPGGINPVTWSGQFVFPLNTSITVNWQWAAAVYSSFSSDYNALGVKAVDDNHVCPYQNSDHAGTPEYYRSYVVGGARGGGGSNFTGSLSATVSVKCPSN